MGLAAETLTMILDAVRGFAAGRLPDERLLELDASDEFPGDVVRAMCGEELGIQLLFIPEAYGGMGGAGMALAGRLSGYDEAGATAPMGGAVSGFAKAFKRECPDALVKVIDFPLARRTAQPAGLLLAETLRDPGAVEVGHHDGQRWSVGLAERPAADGRPGVDLGPDSVYLVTGAAGSIVSAIVADLAAAGGGGTFHLLDLTPAPDPGDADLRRFAGDRDGLKAEVAERMRARGERPTPALIERHGRIDVLVHSAGLEVSRLLAVKEPREFDLVFGVKSDGWFDLLHALGGMPLGATVVFSPVAGRFGNAGQTDYSAANDLLCKQTSALRRTALDPSGQPSLNHHRIDGTGVLPGVMGIEAFAELVGAALPGWRVAAVEPPDGTPLLMAPRLIELAFPTAGIRELGRGGRIGLPDRVGRVAVPRPIEGAAGPVYAIAGPPSAPGRVDAEVVDERGRLLVRLEGYGTVELPAGPEPELLASMRAAMA